MKLNARADIGYLVGYDSRNIWRIWRPQDNAVLRSRDVSFDEHSLYNPNNDSLTPLDELQSIPEILDLPNNASQNLELESESTDEDDIGDTIEVIVRPERIKTTSAYPTEYTIVLTQHLPTPDVTPEPMEGPQIHSAQNNTIFVEPTVPQDVPRYS